MRWLLCWDVVQRRCARYWPLLDWLIAPDKKKALDGMTYWRNLSSLISNHSQKYLQIIVIHSVTIIPIQRGPRYCTVHRTQSRQIIKEYTFNIGIILSSWYDCCAWCDSYHCIRSKSKSTKTNKKTEKKEKKKEKRKKRKSDCYKWEQNHQKSISAKYREWGVKKVSDLS